MEQSNILRGKKTLLKNHQLQSWTEKLKMKGHVGLQVFNLDYPGLKKKIPLTLKKPIQNWL